MDSKEEAGWPMIRHVAEPFFFFFGGGGGDLFSLLLFKLLHYCPYGPLKYLFEGCDYVIGN